MGRSYRFRLSDMMPNAWFYKLRDMSSKQARNGSPLTHSSTSRKTTRIPVTPPRQFPSPTPPPPTPSSSLDRHHPTPVRPGRASYYIPSGDQDRLLCSPAHQPTKFVVVDPPRKSKKKSLRMSKPHPLPAQGGNHAVVTSSPRGTQCGCRETLDSVWTAEAGDLPRDYTEPATVSPMRMYEALDIGYSYNRTASPYKDAVFPDYAITSRRDVDFTVDVEGNSQSPSTTTTTTETTNTFDAETGDVDLPPILTKPAAKKERGPVSDLKSPVKLHKNNHINPQKKKGSSGLRSKRSPPSSLSLGVSLRTRVNSPRLAAASRKTAGQERARRSNAGSAAATTPRVSSTGSCRLSGSLAVVKASSDPRRDFRASMLEMIEENKLWASKDLEELLACYLSLNSSEYHDVIIKVFQQIWFDLTNLNNN